MNDNDFTKFLKNIGENQLSVLDTSIPKLKYIPLDLSESNQELNQIDISSS